MSKGPSKNQIKEIILEELIAILLERKMITEQQLLEEDMSNLISRLLPGSSERSWRKWLKKNPEDEEEIEAALQTQGPAGAAKVAQELSDEDIISVEPAKKPGPAPESPPRLPASALVQRKDVIILPKSTASLKRIVARMVNWVLDETNWEHQEWDAPSQTSPVTGTIIVKMINYLRHLSGNTAYAKEYLQENKTNLIYIKESRLKEILTKEIQEKAQEWHAR